jgi:8-oxo-dGTP pyrophosphatase MutT (NUDIX family)
MGHALTLEQIRQSLTSIEESTIEDPFPGDFFTHPPREAAVLVPFIRHHGEWHLLFIRRTEDDNDRHAGQVAFPGGRLEELDSNPIETALRESKEEVGLRPEHVAILGCLHRLRTVSNYLVTPVIGTFPWPYPLRLAPMEVSRAFLIPYPWLKDPGNHRLNYRGTPFGPNTVEVIHFTPYDGELLWGVSARIVINLVQAMKRGA